MKNKIDTSRRKTPWDNTEQNLLQLFIAKKYKENYSIKHPKLKDTEEAIIFNSIQINKCKYCHNTEIIKRGKTKNGIQLYYCNKCKKRFTPIANTIFENHKISITEWIEYLLELFNYGSISLISKVNKNSINTSIYWLNKVFLVLQHWQDDIVLKGNIYIDEMFYSVIKSDIKTKDGKKLRGLSQNKYCIGIGYDKNNVIAIVEGFGKTSTKKTEISFKTHIKEGSKLIHDGEKAHRKLIKSLNLIDESYNSSFLKEKKDEDNPLRPINHQCDLIRQFLDAHSGFDRIRLQDYLNLYCFMNSNPRNKLEKVNQFIELALNTEISLSYRELFEIKK